MAVGLAATALVARDGSPGWLVLRVLLVLGLTSAAVLAEERAGLRGFAAVTIGVGLAGTIVGAGIGVMHVAKAGVSVVAGAGLVALVAGLVLAGVGTVLAVRSVRGWWRLLAIPVALVVAQLLVLPATVAVYATNVPPTTLGARTPADSGFDVVDVTYRTDDGVRISAWYVPSQNGAAIVVRHGAGSTRTGVLDEALVLARHGYGVLLPDARGHGRSGGDAMDLGWYGDLDVAAAVTWLAGRAEVERIGVYGASMGGEEAIGAAGGDERIAAVVAEGATGRVFADGARAGGGVEGWIERAMTWVIERVADLLSGAEPPSALHEAVRSMAPRPLLLITASEVPDEARAAAHLRQASPSTVGVWTVAGAGHTEGWEVQPAEWEARVVGFFDRVLAPARS